MQSLPYNGSCPVASRCRPIANLCASKSARHILEQRSAALRGVLCNKLVLQISNEVQYGLKPRHALSRLFLHTHGRQQGVHLGLDTFCSPFCSAWVGLRLLLNPRCLFLDVLHSPPSLVSLQFVPAACASLYAFTCKTANLPTLMSRVTLQALSMKLLILTLQTRDSEM